MAEANEHALVSNLSKRTIEISSSKQLIKYATERLQQFKVQFIMSNDFDRNHLFKFIKHFDVMFQKYEEERLAKTFSKKLALHKKDNSNEIGDRKFLNVDYIFQNTKAVISVEKIAEVLKMHDPEYIKNAYYKLQIIDEDELKRRTDSRYYYRSGIRNNIITMQNLFENLQNGAKNDQFKPIVDFIAMYSDLDSIVQSLPRIKSKVIAMAVYDYYEGQYNPRAGVVQRGQYVRVGQQAVNAQQPQVEKSDEDSIAKGIRKNEVLQEYLQFLEMRNSLDSEFIETMFKDLTIAPMANLREFVTFVKNYKEFKKLMNSFKLDKIDNFKSIFPKLDWFGISFDYENSHSHINYKVMPNKDYVKVTAQNYILLYHNLGSKTYVYKIYCADK